MTLRNFCIILCVFYTDCAFAQIHLQLTQEEADSLFSHALPVDSFPSDHNIFDSLIATADDFFLNGNYEQALSNYDLVIPYRDYSSLSYYRRGFCKYTLKNYASAIGDFTKAIKLADKDFCSYWENW